MKPRITVITLGVDDLERAVTFYRDGLGLPTEGIVGTEYPHGAVAFFLVHGGLRLALYPRVDLALDARVPVTPPSSSEFALAHNVASPEEVDLVLQQAERAGATIVKAGQEAFWGGYSGYFRDPDQHLWEVAWNPAWKVED